MTGGTVIRTRDEYDGNIEIVVEDSGEQLAIKVAMTAEARCISECDVVWWQGRKAYWTARNRDGKYNKGTNDVEIPRIGYNYVPNAITT